MIKDNPINPQLILLHGGPGAIGSLHTLTKMLEKDIAVAEQIQTKYTITELVEELHQDLIRIPHKVTLLGHSWGAFFAIIFAAQYPELVNSVLLVGCPPILDDYVKLIEKRRLQRFSTSEAELFNTLLKALGDPDYLDKDKAITQLGELVEKADNFCLEPSLTSPSQADGKMYDSIWQEASKMRSQLKILDDCKKIKCPVYLLQGKYDPHPIEGVVNPLQKDGIIKAVYEFDRSGHTPFLEKYDYQKFNELVIKLSEPLHNNKQ